MINKRCVLTGPPGAGKTSVIEELAKRGMKIIPEPARTLIENYKKNSPELLPNISIENRKLFQNAIEAMTYKDYRENNVGFFDRSMIDEIGYRNRYNIEINQELDSAAKNNRYDHVFIFPFWEEIFINDDIRLENAEEAKIVGDFLHSAYNNYGYSPIIVPKMDILSRVEFIINNIQ